MRKNPNGFARIEKSNCFMDILESINLKIKISNIKYLNILMRNQYETLLIYCLLTLNNHKIPDTNISIVQKSLFKKDIY